MNIIDVIVYIKQVFRSRKMKKILIVIVLFGMMAVLLFGCGAPASSIAGIWYEQNGFGTVEFKGGGKCTQDAMGFKMDGNYTFDEAKGEGEITVEFWGEKSTSSFVFTDGNIVMEGATYTRTKVEQKSISDAFDEAFSEMGDALKGLENLQ